MPLKNVIKVVNESLYLDVSDIKLVSGSKLMKTTRCIYRFLPPLELLQIKKNLLSTIGFRNVKEETLASRKLSPQNRRDVFTKGRRVLDFGVIIKLLCSW